MLKTNEDAVNFQSYERLRGKKGEYEILGNCIKQGGFSAVYKALSTAENGGLVAIKAINLENKKIKRAAHEKRIQSEVEILKKLEDHPRVIKFIDCFHYQKKPEIFCIVLEWAENGDLKDYLKKQGGQLAELEVSRIVSQIVEGIVFFQQHNLVHRDFKLQNILLDKDKNIKITDFGLATELSHSNQYMVTFCGTPNYLPPEVIDRRGYSSQVDIWSLGVLIYHLLVGRSPTEPGKTSTETMKRIQQDQVIIPKLLSEHAKDIILRTLDKNPITRITIHDLEDHPFLLGRKNARIASEVETTTHDSDNAQIRSYEKSIDKSRSSSLRDAVLSYPSTPTRKQIYDPRRRRCLSVERVPSNEVMPPPSSHLLRDPSTGYSSSMSDQHNNLSPKYKSKLLHRYQNPMLNKHNRQGSLPNNHTQTTSSSSSNLYSASSNRAITTLPHINVQRLVPTKIKTNKTVCSIRPEEKAYIEYLDDDSNVKYCIEVDCKTQVCHYYCPRNSNHERLPLVSTPYLPKDDYSPQIFHYPNIPKHLRKTWTCLYKFVELVKAKTPKIKIYTDHGQTMLMESGEFVVMFYNGARYQNTSKKEVYVDPQSNEYNLKDVELKNIDYLNHIEHAKAQHKSSIVLDSAITNIMASNSNGNFEFFPVSMGRRAKVEEPESVRPRRPQSAPLRSRSATSVSRGSVPSGLNVYVESSPTSLQSPISTVMTPPSSVANSSVSSKKSKIIKELNSSKFNQSSPILYACLKSNGNFEFQSERYYFTDKPKKQEIRVRNGNTYFYEEDGKITGSVPDDIRLIINFWLKDMDGRQKVVIQ